MRRQRQQNHPPLSIYCVSPNNADTFYSGKTQQQHTCSQYCGNWSVYDVVGYGSSSVAQAGRGNKPPYWGYYGSVAANTIKPNRLLSPLQHKKIHIAVCLSHLYLKNNTVHKM